MGITSFKEYNEALAPWAKKNGQDMPLELAMLGVAGEVGEVCDLVKKAMWHGKTGFEGDMLKELGDVLWYLDKVAERSGAKLENLFVKNTFAVLDATAVIAKEKFSVVEMCRSLSSLAGTITDNNVGECLRREALRQAAIVVAHIGGFYGFTLSQICEANVAKLRARYPNGFVEGGGIR